MNSVRAAILTLSACVLAGCVQTPVPQLQFADVPDAWSGPVISDADFWPETDWWNNFESEELTGIIELVKENNLDLANNRRNLRAAQITLEEAGFNLFPTPSVQISTGASASASEFGGVGSSGADVGPFQLSGGANYSGILTKLVNYERSLADFDSRIAQVASTALNTMGTAASTYFQLLLIRDRIEAARQNLANAEEIGRITDVRVEVGVAVPIDALQQQITIEQQRNSLIGLIQNDFSARASLAELIGRRVEGFDVAAQTLQDITVPTVQPGLPSELLVRRPDLVQAEASLRSATANVDIARLNFFPQISLTGNANASSDSLLDLIGSPESAAVSLSASLAQTLLDNGQRQRNLEQARLSLQTGLANYRRAVIQAFNDVEVQLRNIQLLEAQGLVAERNLQAAEEAFRIAGLRYDEGVANYQTVLTAQNTLFNSRNSLLDNKLQRLNAVISFYQTLGGGWEQGVIVQY